MVANKSDLYKNEEVDINVAKAYADEINAIFQSTSAQTNMGIDKLFFNLGNKILNPNFDYKTSKEEDLDDKNNKTNNNSNKDKKKEKNDSKNKNNENKIKLTGDKNGKNGKKKCC